MGELMLFSYCIAYFELFEFGSSPSSTFHCGFFHECFSITSICCSVVAVGNSVVYLFINIAK